MQRLPRVAILATLTAVALLGALQIRPVVDFVDTVPDHDGLAPYRAMLAELDGIRFVAVHMPSDGVDLRSDDGFDALVAQQGALQDRLRAAQPSTFTHFLSAHEAMRGAHHMALKIATAGNPPPDSYRLPNDPVTWEAVRPDAIAASADVLAADGSSALLLAFIGTDDATARRVAGQVQHHLDEWDDGTEPTTEWQATGLLVTSHATDARTARDLALWGTVSAAAVAATLWIIVRRASHAAVAALSLGTALLWTFGVVGWSRMPVSFLTVFLAPVVVGIGIDHAIHLLHAASRSGGPGAMRAALRSLRGPMVVATATTAAALLLMALVPAPLFAQLGLVTALGVVMGLAAALLVVPLAGTRRAPAHRRDRIGAAVARLAQRVARRRVPALAATIAVLAVLGAVATQTRIESGSAENEFPQDDPQIVLQHRIEAEYGAFQRAYLVVQGPIADPTVLAAMDRAAAAAVSLPLHRNATSVVDLLRADAATDQGAVDLLTAALGQGDDGMPDTPAAAREALRALFADPLWRTIAPFVVSRELDLSVVAIEVDPWTDQAQLLALRDALHELAATTQAEAGPTVLVSAAGAPMNRAAIIDQTPLDVGLVAGGGVVVVFLVLTLAWAPRRGLEGVRAATVGTLAVGASALVLLATIPLLDGAYNILAGWGAPANNAALNNMFLLAFAVTVGLGVDDFVHVTHAMWRARDRGHPPAEGWNEVGRAVTGTTLTTLAAFAPLAGIYFLQSKNLAVLVCVGVVAAWALTMVAAPWAVRRDA